MTINEIESPKPCPFCGNKDVVRYSNPFHCYIECSQCGATLKNAGATVLYHPDAMPKELDGVKTYEPKLFVIQKKDGQEIGYPDHGYKGVNSDLALLAFGVTQRWNKRHDT